jgi:hypothetical protein
MLPATHIADTVKIAPTVDSMLKSLKGAPPARPKVRHKPAIPGDLGLLFWCFAYRVRLSALAVCDAELLNRWLEPLVPQFESHFIRSRENN